MSGINGSPKCREDIIVEVVNLYKLSDVQRFHDLDRPLVAFFETFDDMELIKRAVYWYRRHRGWPYSKLATRYNISERQVEYMIKNCPQEL